ncbi:hypothetical protein MPSEU_000818400 [Mayamaea pseudoterrestris]|nr:hypothetical protein MPSEU_000818400 [Mayamaea pseudoterrestris]
MFSSQSTASQQKRQRLPLENAVVCLSGISSHAKDDYHALIKRLGGRFTRDLTGENTHLVAFQATGAKYEAATMQKGIQIVHPSWLDECDATNARVNETAHLLDFPHANSIHFSANFTTTRPSASNTTNFMYAQIEKQLEKNAQRHNLSLFSKCRFYLLGFDNGSKHHQLLGRLIRRGMGLIHWELDAQVTHILVQLDADVRVRDIARWMARSGANSKQDIFLNVVSADWVVDSWAASHLLDGNEYPPRYQSIIDSGIHSLDGEDLGQQSLLPNSTTSHVFKGCVFCIIRTSGAYSSDTVNFDAAALEQTVHSHGGRLLSQQLLEAIKTDAYRDTLHDEHQRQRKLYIVIWGAYTSDCIALDPLLSQAMGVCQHFLVTPFWLQLCVAESKLVSPRRLDPKISEAIISPSNCYPWHKLGDVHISISGFSGLDRTTLMHFIQAVAAYDDAMVRHCTTHLIVKQATGDKYDKAVEWGLHVVSLEWLWHVTKFGLSGEVATTNQSYGSDHDTLAKKGFILGCEKQFPAPESFH